MFSYADEGRKGHCIMARKPVVKGSRNVNGAAKDPSADDPVGAMKSLLGTCRQHIKRTIGNILVSSGVFDAVRQEIEDSDLTKKK